MSWFLWTLLISFGCMFVVFLMSCLWIAKQADEKIDQFGPSPASSEGGTQVSQATPRCIAKSLAVSSRHPRMLNGDITIPDGEMGDPFMTVTTGEHGSLSEVETTGVGEPGNGQGPS